MKRFAAVLGVSVLAAAAVLLLSYSFKQLNLIAYDFTMRLAGPLTPTAPITIVAVDDETIQQKGHWPWKREELAKLVQGIARSGPKVVAFDVMLDDAGSEEGDAALASALSAVGHVVLPARIVRKDGAEQWGRPQERFLQPGVAVGHVHTEPDLDTINRAIYSAKAAEGSLLPAFSIETLRLAGTPVDPMFQIVQDTGVSIVRRGVAKIRFDGDTRKTFEQIPAWKVMEGSADAAALHDRIVLVGVTAEGLQEDQWFTPFSLTGLKTPGVEIHANAIDTLYARRWIEDVPPDVLFVSLVAAILLLIWLDRRFEGPRFYAAAVLLIPGFVAVSWILMKQWNTWLPFPPFIAALIFMVPGLEVWKIMRVNRDLDSKIEKLSLWRGAADALDGSRWDAGSLIENAMTPGTSRDAWLDAVRKFESSSSQRKSEHRRLFALRWRNAKWRLGAVDFFSEELVRFLEFNSAILSSIADVIIVCDVRGRVVYQNPAALLLEGFNLQPEFAPAYFASLVDGRDFVPAFAEVLGEGKSVSMSFVPGKSGRQVFHVSISPIGKAGLVLSLHDATAQHELNLAKNEMVSLVSHELRTPLTAIRGYSDMLLKYDLVQDKGKKFLGTIVEESDRLGKLIQSFLDIAYIESGRQKVTKTDVEIDPLLRDLRSVLDPVAAAKQIRLETAGDGASRVHADRLLLYQALSNLVTNAIKYSPEGTVVEIGASNGSGAVAFAVKDEGCGIPADEAGKIFEKFYRRANKETLEQSGFGLGLAFVKEVAARHGGDVVVESEVGKGSVFILRIPV